MLIILYSLYQTGSRVGFLAALLSIMIMFFIKINQKSFVVRMRYYIVFALSLLFVFIILPSSIKERYLNIASYFDGSNMKRLEIWTNAVEVFFKRPFVGYGPGKYGPDKQIRHRL